MGIQIIKAFVILAFLLFLFNAVIYNAQSHCECDKEHKEVTTQITESDTSTKK